MISLFHHHEVSTRQRNGSGGVEPRTRERSNVHGKDGCTAADIKNNLVLENMLVLHNGIHVRPGADLIFLERLACEQKHCIAAGQKISNSGRRGSKLNGERGGKLICRS